MATQAKRYTVCPAVVGALTSNIMWNDAEHAAVVGAPAVSPYAAGSPSDREWTRTFNRARYDLKLCGFTATGRQVAA